MERKKILINTDLFQVLPDRAQRVVLTACISGKVDELISFREDQIRWAVDGPTLRRGIGWLSASDLVHSTGEDYWLNPTIAHELSGNPWGKWADVKHIPF